eukprot:GHVQ01005020.1.p1 GENE.GHVQ01005020.1~~GHVQ01005020.1.p1  ORF type:complete len:124 (-),score=0.33 GHVQ01005020.1:154-525(-)
MDLRTRCKDITDSNAFSRSAGQPAPRHVFSNLQMLSRCVSSSDRSSCALVLERAFRGIANTARSTSTTRRSSPPNGKSDESSSVGLQTGPPFFSLFTRHPKARFFVALWTSYLTAAIGSSCLH